MAECRICGNEPRNHYTCSYCGHTHCSEHRLPENHDCNALTRQSTEKRFETLGPNTSNRSTHTQRKDRVRKKQTSKRENRVSNREEAVSQNSSSPVTGDSNTTGEIADRTKSSDGETANSKENDSNELPPPTKCPDCGSEDGIKYSCNYCGREFCPRHRLPEKHDCSEVSRAARANSSAASDRRSDSPSRGLDAETHKIIKPEAIPGRTPDSEEIIDDKSPDVALDGSIADEESEPIRSESSQNSGGLPRWVITLAVLILVLTVAIIAFL